MQSFPPREGPASAAFRLKPPLPSNVWMSSAGCGSAIPITHQSIGRSTDCDSRQLFTIDLAVSIGW
jgi:hypothetical protein